MRQDKTFIKKSKIITIMLYMKTFDYNISDYNKQVLRLTRFPFQANKRDPHMIRLAKTT
jgi:hypothetical protein